MRIWTVFPFGLVERRRIFRIKIFNFSQNISTHKRNGVDESVIFKFVQTIRCGRFMTNKWEECWLWRNVRETRTLHEWLPRRELCGRCASANWSMKILWISRTSYEIEHENRVARLLAFASEIMEIAVCFAREKKKGADNSRRDQSQTNCIWFRLSHNCGRTGIRFGC